MHIPFTLDFSRTFLLIVLMKHPPALHILVTFACRFLAPQSLVIIFSFSMLKFR